MSKQVLRWPKLFEGRTVFDDNTQFQVNGNGWGMSFSGTAKGNGTGLSAFAYDDGNGSGKGIQYGKTSDMQGLR